MSDCRYLLLHCVDHRIQEPIHDWLVAEHHTGDTDIISIVGSCLHREEALENIRFAVKAHHISHVVLTQHLDCGAYGGHTAFDSPAEERETLICDMAELKEELLASVSGIEVLTLLLKDSADGWQIEPIASPTVEP